VREKHVNLDKNSKIWQFLEGIFELVPPAFGKCKISSKNFKFEKFINFRIFLMPQSLL